MPFPNKDTQFTSGKVAVEAQRKSAESRKQNRERRKAFKAILDEEFDKLITISDSDRKVTRKEAAGLRLMQILLDAGTPERDFLRAIEFARDTIGEKPTERIMVTEVDPDIVEEIESIVLNDKTRSD